MRNRPGPGRGTAARSRTAGPVQSQDIREWAWRNGYDAPERGRIPAAVRKAYDAAHNSS
ncbi:Lsr2 family DNA-binding protein [Streptomyces inhibens]|uniref:Lsr2 family DNA-binding protein n=1 Tax=Streptomyces inhibens TaxID=2293571 RepID=UPI003CCA2D44|nr:Lsr2 family protein [Streptomyces inhibens]